MWVYLQGNIKNTSKITNPPAKSHHLLVTAHLDHLVQCKYMEIQLNAKS